MTTIVFSPLSPPLAGGDPGSLEESLISRSFPEYGWSGVGPVQWLDGQPISTQGPKQASLRRSYPLGRGSSVVTPGCLHMGRVPCVVIHIAAGLGNGPNHCELYSQRRLSSSCWVVFSRRTWCPLFRRLVVFKPAQKLAVHFLPRITVHC
jgi:hypothetical protein